MTIRQWNHMQVTKPEVGQVIEWQSPIEKGVLEIGRYCEDGWCVPVREEPWAKCQPKLWRPIEEPPHAR